MSNQRPAYLLLSAWLVQGSFLPEEFLVEMSPQSYSTSFYHWGEKFNKLIFKGQKNFFCTYLTSMPSKKKILRFVVFCILAWLSFCLMLLMIRCFRHFLPCTLFSLWLPGDRVSRTDCKTWTEKSAQMDWELKHFCDSHIYKCRSQAEKNGSEGLWKWEISHSLKMICVLF